MRQTPRLFRLTATVAIGAMLGGAIRPTIATAQPAPPPPSVVQPDQAQPDPPTRVGRIASQTGAVSFRTSADTQWSAATRNYPVSAGNAFWTEPTAHAELEISASRVALDGGTEFDLTGLDDTGLQAVVPLGEAYFRLRGLAPNEVWSVQTPRGMVRITEPGRYAIVAGTTEQPTQVTVLEGSAEIEGPGLSLRVEANQTATVTGSDPFEGSVGPAERDGFVTARLNAERPPPRARASIPAELMDIPGVEDLSGYGEWADAPDYGQVWYPPATMGWVPYRDGSWAYVAPWGWTWIDSTPWGFAPSHYGRWAHIGGRWGWVPGDHRGAERRPAYAPALVAFLGVSAGVAARAAIRHRPVAWVPLGPRETYHPWYHASRDYSRRINAGHVTDPAAIDRPMDVNGFVNRSAATSVPASVLTGSRPVRWAARPLPGQALGSAQPLTGQQPLRPTVATLGVTPAVARQLSLVPAGIEAFPRRAAPGPAARPLESGLEGRIPPRPALIGPHGEPPAIPRPGEAVVPVGPGRPAGPPLPIPGTRPPWIAEPRDTRPPGATIKLVPPGSRPEGVLVPAPRVLGVPREPPIPLAPPGVRTDSIFRPPPGPDRPQAVDRPILVPRVMPAAPEIRQPLPPRAFSPEPPRIEQFRPPPPHIETPRPPPPHVEQFRPPPPHIETPRPPPPHVEQFHPPSPHVEAPRPAPPPRIEAPRPAPPKPEPEHKRPGQR